nr:MAG TPA: hypothetical protein [Caudoviricetes sp.]
MSTNFHVFGVILWYSTKNGGVIYAKSTNDCK